MTESQPRILLPSFRGYERGVVRFLYPLLSRCSTDAAVRTNVDYVVSALQTPDLPLRHEALVALTRVAAAGRAHDDAAVCQSLRGVDAAFVQCLSDSAALAPQAKTPSKGLSSLVGKLSAMAGPGSSNAAALEPDGSPARDCYTVLNYVYKCGAAHVLDATAFSVALRWLHARRRAEASDGPLLAAMFAHCERVVEQCAAVAPAADTDDEARHDDSGAATPATPSQRSARTRSDASAATPVARERAHAQFAFLDPVSALGETARLVARLCTLDAAWAARGLPLLRRAFERLPSGGGAASAASHSFAHTQLLSALLTHVDAAAVVDVGPLLRTFFTVFLPRHTTDAAVALDTFLFCQQHCRALALGTGVAGSMPPNAFAAYFPAILKLFAWCPVAHFDALQDLLPFMADSRTFVELFHLLLDLPLVAAALERQHCENQALDESKSSSASSHSASDGNTNTGAHRVLYNFLLRSEAGVSFNLWQPDSTTLPLLLSFCAQTPFTPLVETVCNQTPRLLVVLFEQALLPEPSCYSSLLPVVCARFEYIAQLPGYEDACRSQLCRFVEQLFLADPSLVVSQRNLIVDLLGDFMPKQYDLVCEMCWCVGQYSTLANCRNDPELLGQVLDAYHQPLELLAYELVSAAREDRRKLLLLCLSTLTKFAARRLALVPRVMLFLVKCIKSSVDEAVLARAHECVRFLRSPLIAGAIIDTPYNATASEHLAVLEFVK